MVAATAPGRCVLNLPINPNLSLQIKPLEFEDPIAQFTKVAQARNLIGQTQLHQQQMQHNELAMEHQRVANQEQQRTIQGRQELADLLTKHSTPGEDGSTTVDHYAVMKGLNDKGYSDLAKGWDTQRRLDLASEVKTNKEKLDSAKTRIGLASSLMGAVRNAPENADKQALLTQALNEGVAQKIIPPEYAQQHAQYDPAWVEQQYQMGIDADKQIDNAQKALEFRQKVVTEAPKTAKEWNDLAFGQASGARSQGELDFTRKTLKDAGAPPHVLEQIPDMWSQAAVDQLARKSMKPEEVQKLAFEERRVKSEEGRAEQTKKNEDEMRQIQRGRLAIASRADQRAAQIYEQTYGEGANPALTGVEPKLRTKALGEASKAADNFVKGQAASADMQSLIDLARSGNKLAYRMVPLEGVLEITTPRGTVRINKQELDAYGGAGSFFDKIAGSVGGALTGASIPKNVLNDIEAAHKKLETGVEETYNQKLNGINQNFRSDFKPVPSRAKAGTIRARDPQGNLHEAPAGTKLPAGWKLE